MADTKEEKDDLVKSVSDENDQETTEENEAILNGVDDLPLEAKKRIKVFEESFGMMGVGRFSQESEIAKKINEKHISDYLDGAREQMNHDYKERHERKIFTVVLVVVALIFFVVIIQLLKENPSVMENIICSVVSLLAGAFGGYGLGRHKSGNDD